MEGGLGQGSGAPRARDGGRVAAWGSGVTVPTVLITAAAIQHRGGGRMSPPMLCPEAPDGCGAAG